MVYLYRPLCISVGCQIRPTAQELPRGNSRLRREADLIPIRNSSLRGEEGLQLLRYRNGKRRGKADTQPTVGNPEFSHTHSLLRNIHTDDGTARGSAVSARDLNGNPGFYILCHRGISNSA